MTLWLFLAAAAAVVGALPTFFFLQQVLNSASFLAAGLGLVRAKLPPALRWRPTPTQAHATADPSASMRAAQYAEHGPTFVTQVVSDAPRPVPSPDQMLIRVAAAALNPVDFKIRRQPMPPCVRPMPKVLAFDVAGVVVHCPTEPGSPTREPKFKVGDRVIAMVPFLGSRWGTAAEFVAVHPSLASLAPAEWRPSQAAALPLVGLTVVQAVAPAVASLRRSGGGTEGKRVLVHAGAGGVGSFAVQYAKHVLGMHVTATCSRRNDAWVRGIGADATHDYAAAPFEDALAGFDMVIDPMAYVYRQRTLSSPTLLKRGYWTGHYVHIASTSWEADKSGKVGPTAAKFQFLQYAVTNSLAVLGLAPRVHGPSWVRPDGVGLERIVAHVDAGLVQPVVEDGSVYALADVEAAYARLEKGHVRGKLAVRLGDRDEYM